MVGKSRAQPKYRYVRQAVPYTKQESKKTQGFFGRLKSLVQAAPHPDEGRALRDFAFGVAGGNVAFFERREDSLAPWGDLRHGDRLKYRSGVKKGSLCTVIGVRGGNLWVFNDSGDATGATALMGDTREKVQAVYDFENLCVKSEHLEEAALPVEWNTDPRVISFLQTAPDIKATVGDQGVGSLTAFLTPMFIKGFMGWAADKSGNITGGGVRNEEVTMVSGLLIHANNAADDDDE